MDYDRFAKNKEGGFQHITSDTLNDQEIWDDTLVMSVLFLANYGSMVGHLTAIITLQKPYGDVETVGLQWQYLSF